MGGTYRRLGPGRYHLVVQSGAGPAGVRRSEGDDVVVGVEGGVRDFAVGEQEQVFYWWRGPEPRADVRLEKRRLRSRAHARPSFSRGAVTVPRGP